MNTLFWLDAEGPVAATLQTCWVGDESWQVDPILIPGTNGLGLSEVWRRTVELVSGNARRFDLPIRDDDPEALDLAREYGLTAASRFAAAWLDEKARPARIEMPRGFHITDRTEANAAPHPLVARNGRDVERRLQELSLYDPHLDIAVRGPDDGVVAYSLFWFDPVTRVGLVEPVRVEDDFQRRGLATAMLRAGIDRLFEVGAERVKVTYSTPEASALYRSLGFRQAYTATWFGSAPHQGER